MESRPIIGKRLIRSDLLPLMVRSSNKKSFIFIDEIQRIPSLLNTEVPPLSAPRVQRNYNWANAYGQRANFKILKIPSPVLIKFTSGITLTARATSHSPCVSVVLARSFNNPGLNQTTTDDVIHMVNIPAVFNHTLFVQALDTASNFGSSNASVAMICS